MKSRTRFAFPRTLTLSLALLGMASAAHAQTAPAKTGSAPAAAPFANQLEGFRLGMNRVELTRAITGVGGVIDKEYDVHLRAVPPGTRMRAIESERDALKRAFENSLLEFNDTPTGMDSGALSKEYTYANRESVMLLQRPEKKRYFFFIGDKLWKVYDEVPLGGALGSSFAEARVRMATRLGSQPKAVAADAQNVFPTVAWNDSAVQLRLIDRSAQNLAGVVYEDRATLALLPTLRVRQPKDPFALDPSISAVTQGGISDPNAHVAGEEDTKPAKGKGKKKK